MKSRSAELRSLCALLPIGTPVTKSPCAIVQHKPEPPAKDAGILRWRLRLVSCRIAHGRQTWLESGKRKRAADNPLCAGRPKILNFSPVVEDKQI